MKLFIALYQQDYDDQIIIGIYSTYEKALEQRIVYAPRQKDWINFSIEDKILDK